MSLATFWRCFAARFPKDANAVSSVASPIDPLRGRPVGEKSCTDAGRGARRETGNAAAGRRANSGAALPADAATTWHSGLFAPCLVRLEAAYGGSRYRPL